MKNILLAAAVAAASAVAAPGAFAQEPAAAGTPPSPQAPPAPTAVAAPAACCVIPAGTPVVLELLEELASDTKVRGQRFGVRLAEPIVIDGKVVIPAGARGTGEVVDAAKAGMGGRPGELIIAARYLSFGSVEVPLRSFKLGGHGENNSKDAQTAVILVGVGGLFIRGGDIVMPLGLKGPAKVARDVTVPPQPDAAPAQVQEGKPDTP